MENQDGRYFVELLYTIRLGYLSTLRSPNMSSTQRSEMTPDALLKYWDAVQETSFLKAFWRDYKNTITRSAAIFAFFIGWESVVRSGAVDPLFLSSPLLVIDKMIEMFMSGEIYPHLIVSGQEAGIGFGLALLVGIPTGIAMGRHPLLRHTIEPFIMAKYSSPTVAFLPLLIIWLGIGLWSKVALIFLGGVFVLIINTQAGVANVDQRLIETARSFTATERQILFKVVLPAAIPFILAGLRLAVGRVLIMVVVAEFYASNAGLGYLIFEAGAQYDTTVVFVGVIILALVGIALSEMLRLYETKVAVWQASQ